MSVKTTVLPPSPQDDAVVLLSGGTTGTPKGVPAWHLSLVITAVQFRAWFDDALVDGVDRVMLPLPPFHSYGACLVPSVYLLTLEDTETHANS